MSEPPTERFYSGWDTDLLGAHIADAIELDDDDLAAVEADDDVLEVPEPDGR